MTWFNTSSATPPEPPDEEENMEDCDLCSSPRAWLRIEERDGFGVNRQSIRILEVDHEENCWQSPGMDLSIAPSHSYDVCAHGHVRETGRTGDRIKVCLLGPVGGGKSQLRETLMRIQAPRLAGSGGQADPFANVRLGPTGRRFSPLPAKSRRSIGATYAASGDDLRATIERNLQNVFETSNVFGTSDDVVAGFEAVLHNALRATTEGQVYTDAQLNSWLETWGRGRPPYLRSVNVIYHESNLEGRGSDDFEVAFVDLPGEAADAWTNPNAENYVGSFADVKQLYRSAHLVAVVDPLAAGWCLKHLKDSLALRLSMRPAGTPAQDELFARGYQAGEAIKSLIAVMTDTLSKDRSSVSATLVLTKCDAIRVVLEKTPQSDGELGRWTDIIPRGARRAFEDCALAAFDRCAAWDARSVDPSTWEFLSAVSAMPRDQRMRIVRSMLAQLSDPQAFWALAHSEEETIELNFDEEFVIPATVPLMTRRPTAPTRTATPTHGFTVPTPTRTYGNTLTVPTSNATWNAGLGVYRLQMRDVLSAVMVSALLSTIVGKNAIDQLLGPKLLVRFALTSAWTRVDEDGEELIEPSDEDAGCLQLYRYILAPFLGHGVRA